MEGAGGAESGSAVPMAEVEQNNLAHQIAVSNAILWVESVYGPKMKIELGELSCEPLSGAEYAEQEQHYQLMGLVTPQQKTEWLKQQLKKLISEKLLQRQSTLVFLKLITKNKGDRYDFAIENWHLEGLPAKPILAADLRGNKRDFQGLNWTQLTGSTFAEGRQLRKDLYQLVDPNRRVSVPDEASRVVEFRGSHKPETADFMRFSRFDFLNWKPAGSVVAKPRYRNAMAVVSDREIFRTKHNNKVHWAYGPGKAKLALLLGRPNGQGNPNSEAEITAIGAKYGVLVAGAAYGEYGVRSTLDGGDPNSWQGTGYIKGERPPAIWQQREISYVEIVKTHTSDLARAVLSSAEGKIYIMDCVSGRILSDTRYSPNAIYCTAQAPDRRLTAVAGYNREFLIAEADGARKVLKRLSGHFDSVAACAWSDNGVHLATGGLDQLVKIWDARMWTDRLGRAKPLTTIASKISAVRGLEFSPIGSGRRCLMMREEADIVSFLDATSWEEKQSIEVLGQILGGGWTDDGQKVMIGVQDDHVGGMLTLERCGWGQGDEYAPVSTPNDDDAFDGFSFTNLNLLSPIQETKHLRQAEYPRPLSEEEQREKVKAQYDALMVWAKKEKEKIMDGTTAASHRRLADMLMEAEAQGAASGQTVARHIMDLFCPKPAVNMAQTASLPKDPQYADEEFGPWDYWTIPTTVICNLCKHTAPNIGEASIHRILQHPDVWEKEDFMAKMVHKHKNSEVNGLKFYDGELQAGVPEAFRAQPREEEKVRGLPESLPEREEVVRIRTKTHWRRKAAMAGDWSELI